MGALLTLITYVSMGLRLAALRGRQSSAISRLHADPQAFTPASLRSTLVSLGNAKVCQLTVSP